MRSLDFIVMTLYNYFREGNRKNKKQEIIVILLQVLNLVGIQSLILYVQLVKLLEIRKYGIQYQVYCFR